MTLCALVFGKIVDGGPQDSELSVATVGHVSSVSDSGMLSRKQSLSALSFICAAVGMY